ncbi:YIF1-domain-containing protein [Xylariomycetidae sp. FL2044]|nr:YIF1-domain-containing protein [Xylariomycetidae sp. FL2044]
MQQGPAYGQSPPLHHPVPQHVSTVPQLRSPPPPTSSQPQQQGYGGNPYQQGTPAAGSNVFGAYGNFMNDPMAAQFVGQVGQNAFKHVEQNMNRWINFSALKHYFNVSNQYVVNKLFLVLFPWRHKPWSRKQVVGPNGQEGWFLPPRDDINSPDMYIPVMALVTYILLSTLLAGLRGEFQPELLGYTASTAGVVVILEILLLKLGCYFLSISNQSQLLDLVAYSGYKFVGIIVTVATAELVNGGRGTGGWIGWSVFLYTFLANSLFLMRSLRYVLLPESSGGDSRGPMQTDTRTKRNQRTQFLFAYSYLIQLLFITAIEKRFEMAPSPIVSATIQSAVLAATSNVLAQCLTAYQRETYFMIDWVPVFQFVVFALLNTPPNFLWQDFLESTFPAYHASPTKAAVTSASAGDEKSLDKDAQEGKLIEPKLNKTNTAIKMILDQTIGAALNTFLFSLYIHSIQAAMARPLGAPLSNPDKSLKFLTSPGAVNYNNVDWNKVVASSRAEFYSILSAGWRLWPLVSLVNFTLVPTIEGRNLVGSLAGVAWGIYMSLLAAH